ncbi:MAG: dihydrofolate reductase [Planctomycetota bacterium]
MTLSVIVAAAENGVIGREGGLPWRLSADLKRFKRITMGHPMVMGRKTWESIGRALPGRTSIVVSRQPHYDPGVEGVLTATDLDGALKLAVAAPGGEEVFVIGGAQLYAAALPRADKLYLTRVHAEVAGDVFLPEVDLGAWRVVTEEGIAADDTNGYSYTCGILVRNE